MYHVDENSVLKELHAVPNLLTFLRLCLIPFVLLAVLGGHYGAALGLFIVAGASDALDGLAARWLNEETHLGRYLDPIADKLLLSALFLVLTYRRLIPVPVTILVLSRDIGILLVATLLYAALGIREFKPSIYGKLNTCVQILALLSVLVYQLYAPWPLAAVRKALLIATGILAIFTAAHYAWRTAREPAVHGKV